MSEPMTAPAPDAIVTLDEYTVRYGKFTAVDRATFSMPPGACGLLGKNGAGKSSILKAILGLVEPAGGSARVLGLDAATEPKQLRDRVGYMPEKEAYLPGLSGLDSVILAGRLSGLPAGDAKQRAHEVLWLVGLGEARYRDVATYSLGMKQKIKLATALVHDAQLLFLDEPTNGLDPDGRTEILDLLRDLVRVKGKSLILSSHILSDVESLCENAVLIEGGRVIAQGRIEDLTRGVGRAFELVVAGEPGPVARRFAEIGMLDGDPDADVLKLRLTDEQTTSLVFDVLRQAGARVQRFEPARRSLSDVFLDSVSADARAVRDEKGAGA